MTSVPASQCAPSLRMIALVSDARQTCGVESFARHLAAALVRTGARVEIAVLPGTLAGLLRLAGTFGPGDRILCNLPVVAWKRCILAPLLLFLLARLRGARITAILHEWRDLDWKRRIAFCLYLGLASDILASSLAVSRQIAGQRAAPWLPARLRGLLPIPPNVRRPATTRSTPLAVQMRDWRRDGRFVLASFGSIYPKKHAAFLLEIAAALRQRGQRPVLVMIGDFVAGEDQAKDRFEARARHLGLDGDVVVSGYIPGNDKLFGLFDEVDVFAYRFAEGLTARRGSVLASLQAHCPVIVNGPSDPREFDHHPLFLSLVTGGRLTMIPHGSNAEDYAAALVAARTLPAAATPLDVDAWWTDAALALLLAHREAPA